MKFKIVNIELETDMYGEVKNNSKMTVEAITCDKIRNRFAIEISNKATANEILKAFNKAYDNWLVMEGINIKIGDILE